MFKLAVVAICLISAQAAVPEHLVTGIPGFPSWGSTFKVYSGLLNVTYPTPVAGYTGTVVHYQFHTSQGESTDPVVAWHTGGPGGSSVYGQYAEMGHFQVGLNGSEHGSAVTTHVNEYSWNNVAHMLYMEEPAGSFLTPDDLRSGFSYCLKNGVRQEKCSWNDVTQAQSYAFVLQEFFKLYPEYAKNEFYLAGESYAGQYVPNIAHHILQTPAHSNLNLKGIAVGNGCWGGDATSVVCNGPNEDGDDVQFYAGKGLVSRKLHNKIVDSCKFAPDGSSGKHSVKCDGLLEEMHKAVGPHNVYNVYDDCVGYGPDSKLGIVDWFKHTGKSERWLLRFLRSNMHNLPKAHAELDAMGAAATGAAGVTDSPGGGGYDWYCGQFAGIPEYFKRPDVRTALHLPNKNGAVFDYDTSGPASVTLYPELIKAIRVLIYNGDADSCVPYVGNQEWTSSMVDQGVVTELKPWHPWYSDVKGTAPAGYATTYSNNFTFITIKLAGHQVPKNVPATSLAFFKRFLTDGVF